MPRLSVLIALLLTAVALPGAGAAAAPRDGDVVPGAYIVALRADAGVAPRAHAARFGAEVGHVYGAALRGYSARMSAAQARRVAADPAVAAVAPDRVVSLDRVSGGRPPAAAGRPGAATAASTQSLPTGIDRVDGELSSTRSGDGSGSVNVDVAVIDTGIDVDHPDLNVVGGRNCSTGRSYNDGHGHGTHVAGSAAARDNTIGVVGVAPGARLWAVRVLNNAGFGSTSSVVCGIDWVTANANTIEVANMSLGGSGSDDGNCGKTNNDIEHQAICRSVAAGVTYAVAAGNSSDDAKNHIPAAYDEVMTVSALADFDGKPGGLAAPTCRSDKDDTFANFSNYGADIDLIAPGVCINSTWKGGGYNTISGTSMASPHVAGAAALYKANNPGASPTQVKSALQGAGTTDWNNADDPDGTKEKLLNVKSF